MFFHPYTSFTFMVLTFILYLAFMFLTFKDKEERKRLFKRGNLYTMTGIFCFLFVKSGFGMANLYLAIILSSIMYGVGVAFIVECYTLSKEKKSTHHS